MSVRNALLGLLAQRSRHGYELHAAFEAMVGGKQNWDVKPAQIYTTLSRLKEGSLVAEESLEQEGGPERRIYTITEAGLKEVHAWLSTAVKAEHQRDEFFLKLILSLAIEGSDPGKIIFTQRSSLYRNLHNLTVQKTNADPQTELAYILLLEQATAHVEADIRWLDMVESRLEEIRRQPLPEPEVRPRGRPPKNR